MMSNFLLHFAHLAVKRLWVLLKPLTLAGSHSIFKVCSQIRAYFVGSVWSNDSVAFRALAVLFRSTWPIWYHCFFHFLLLVLGVWKELPQNRMPGVSRWGRDALAKKGSKSFTGWAANVSGSSCPVPLGDLLSTRKGDGAWAGQFSRNVLAGATFLSVLHLDGNLRSLEPKSTSWNRCFCGRTDSPWLYWV